MLPRLDVSGYFSLFTTQRELWVLYPVSSSAEQIRRVTAEGLSAPITLPGNYGIGDFVDWNGTLLYLTQDRAAPLFRLVNGTFKPFTPAVSPSLPDTRIYVAGNRLFQCTAGSDPQVLGTGGWLSTPGALGSSRVDRFLHGDSGTYAVRGAEIWRLDGSEWTRLPRPPLAFNVPTGFVFQGRPVLFDTSHVLTFDGSRWVVIAETGRDVASWNSAPASLVRPDEFWFSASIDRLYRYRDGTLQTFVNAEPLDPTGQFTTSSVRDIGGDVVVFGVGGGAFHLQNDSVADTDSLVPAFPDLSGFFLRDGASVNGHTYLLVQAKPGNSPARPSLVERTVDGFRPLVMEQDYSQGLIRKQGEDFLAVQGNSLLFGGLSLTGDRLRAQRADRAGFTLDSSGNFATHRFEDSFVAAAVPDGLLLPVLRVRKTVPAAVDATGVGGLRYRTTLVVANLSASTPCVARLLPGTSDTAALELPLSPGEQRIVEDPAPGFVGPLAVEFEGLDEDQDAFAAVRVFNPAGQGTAGGVLVGRDAGSVAGRNLLLAPSPRTGSRLHMAASAAVDGPGQDLTTIDYGFDPAVSARVPAGALFQTDPTPKNLMRVLDLGASYAAPTDDLLAYCVRNDAGANDVTIAEAEPTAVLFARLERFLPAVVSVESSYARYRTEISFGRFATDVYPPQERTYTVSFRPSGSASPPYSFPVTVAGDVLHVPDAAAWLRSNGAPVGEAVEGTLSISGEGPTGASDLLVGAVVLARPTNSSAEYGTAVPAFAEGAWAHTRAVVPGLLESHAFRSNVAVANPEPDGGPSVTLSVDLRAADGSRIATLPSVTLRPGERRQFNRPLASRGGEGYAVITRVGGEGRFVAYGVVNDNATGSGSLFEMTRAE